MIIDAHLHLDPSIDGSAETAAEILNFQLEEAGISKAIVLHLENQPWSPTIFANAILKYKSLVGFINIHPYNDSAAAQLKYGINTLGFTGLKLHPRLQEFQIDDERTVKFVRFAGELGVPVLIDAFPDGTHLMQGFDPVKYANLACKCPQTKMIWAHMGGHYVLDFMMLAKRLPNVYMDTSYSLLYYRGSSIVKNMIYSMRSMRFERIFYGSDYPDRPVRESLDHSVEIFRTYGLCDDEINKILSLNILSFLNESN